MAIESEIKPAETPKTSWLGIAAILSAIGASACCVGPLLLLSLGLGGAWMSTLTSMTVVRPFFIGLTLCFIGMAYFRLYRSDQSCNEGDVCALTQVQRNQRLIFWLVSVVLLLLLAFPWIAPYFL